MASSRKFAFCPACTFFTWLSWTFIFTRILLKSGRLKMGCWNWSVAPGRICPCSPYHRWLL